MAKGLDMEQLRLGAQPTRRALLALVVRLSMPAILARLSTVVMQYIDASMAGSLGADAAASIGLVSSSTWLLGGLCGAVSTGFTVQIANRIGAGDEKGARRIVRQGLVLALCASFFLLVCGSLLSRILPGWMGGTETVLRGAERYLLIYALSLPLEQLNGLAAGMLQCSGNMRVPGILETVMCGLDVVFNALLIFPSGTLHAGPFSLPGAGLGVTGAALGTALSQLVTASAMLFFLLVRSGPLHLRRERYAPFSSADLKRAAFLALPVAGETVVTCGAYILSTRIVSPLGTVSVAANSLAVTAESVCFMPGYGISAAATAIIGQCIGAGRRDLTREAGWLIALLGMVVMGAAAVLLWLFAPWLMGLLSPDPEIRALGTAVLRIEAFAEPLYAASIVITGIFRGMGDTLSPSLLNLVSMWVVRLPLSALLAGRIGLRGVWGAMCLELCVRGTLFLIRLARKTARSRESPGKKC